MVKMSLILALFGGMILLQTSCATIVSKSVYPVSINSTPSGANIVVTNKEGAEVYSGKTPVKLELKSGNGFFSKAHYQVRFMKEGYAPKTVSIDSSLNPWYFGNIVFGGFIGFLIVDPLTGAMYKIDNKYVDATLAKENGESAYINNSHLNIVSLNEIPQEWKAHLVKVNE